MNPMTAASAMKRAAMWVGFSPTDDRDEISSLRSFTEPSIEAEMFMTTRNNR